MISPSIRDAWIVEARSLPVDLIVALLWQVVQAILSVVFVTVHQTLSVPCLMKAEASR